MFNRRCAVVKTLWPMEQRVETKRRPSLANVAALIEVLLESAKGLVGAAGFELATPCAQVGFQRFVKCLVFKLLVSLEMAVPY
jgi:hypothetical protein